MKRKLILNLVVIAVMLALLVGALALTEFS